MNMINNESEFFGGLKHEEKKRIKKIKEGNILKIKI